MPGRKDAEELDRETDRMIAERDAQAAAAERRRQEEERVSREAKAKKGRDDSLWVVQSSARTIDQLDEELAWRRAALRNWNERNREFLNVAAAAVALFLLLMASPFAVATLDFLMLSYVGREIARGAVESFKSVGGNGVGWIILIAVLLFTLGYVVVELVIGGARDNERIAPNVRRGAGQLAVMLWIILPLFIVIFSLFASGIFSGDPTKTLGRATLTAAIVRAALFGAFAMAIHGFVLRFGSAVIDSYGYGLFKSRQMYITRRIRSLERLRSAAGGDLETNFRDFHGAVTGDGSGPQVKVGPFGATTARVTNAEMGATVIETPETDRTQTSPTANGAGQTRTHSSQYDTSAGANAAPPAEERDATHASQAQQNRGETEDEWPGTVYDMSDEDEVR